MLVINGCGDFWEVDKHLGNGFVLCGNLPLPRPLLSQFYVAMSHH